MQSDNNVPVDLSKISAANPVGGEKITNSVAESKKVLNYFDSRGEVRKCVRSLTDFEEWKRSASRREISEYVNKLARCLSAKVRLDLQTEGHNCNEHSGSHVCSNEAIITVITPSLNSRIEFLQGILHSLNTLIDETPPLPQQVILLDSHFSFHLIDYNKLYSI